MNDIEALLFLISIPQLGAVKIKLLIKQWGSASVAAQQDPCTLNLPPSMTCCWQSKLEQREWEKERALIEQEGIRLIPYWSTDYPKRLLDVTNHPLLLYVQGDLLPKDSRCLAIVGTRQATLYGMDMASKISADLAQAGFSIVSGLARGIDTAAHEAALKYGRTIGVIGSGLANIYPKENIILGHRISKRGALISEFSMHTPPDRLHFPQRNRIVSGLTLGTILIEAPENSGAMITVEKAIQHGRPVFALPGRVDHENFKGNHRLIKKGQAKLIEGYEDIVQHFDHLFDISATINKESLTKPPLDREEAELVQKLPAHEISIDEIATLTQWPMTKLNVLLMSLILKKYMKEYPGKIYKKNY